MRNPLIYTSHIDEDYDYWLNPDEPIVCGITLAEAWYDGVPSFETYVVLPNPKAN